MSLQASEPNPYEAKKRLLALRRPERDKLLRLIVRCEQRKCAPLRIFAVREGLLVLCRSDANVGDMQEQYPYLTEWSRRRAFFIKEWLDEGPSSRLQVVCDCSQTTPRLVDMQKVIDLIPPTSEPTRNAVLPEVMPSVLQRCRKSIWQPQL